MQLLQRLPKALYASLSGRIIMFLSNVMPLDERSGMNLLGVLNTSHALQLENVPPVSHPAAGQ